MNMVEGTGHVVYSSIEAVTGWLLCRQAPMLTCVGLGWGWELVACSPAFAAARHFPCTSRCACLWVFLDKYMPFRAYTQCRHTHGCTHAVQALGSFNTRDAVFQQCLLSTLTDTFVVTSLAKCVLQMSSYRMSSLRLRWSSVTHARTSSE